LAPPLPRDSPPDTARRRATGDVRRTRGAVRGQPSPQPPPSPACRGRIIGYLTEIGSSLYELIKGRNLATYPDDEIRLAISRSVAVEGARGWKIAKEKSSHKIDVVVALAMAAHACVQDSQMQATQFPRLDFDSGVPRNPTGVMGGSPYTMGDFDNLSWR
jgi:hypothetical protein